MIVNCQYCGKSFDKKSADINRTKYNYCSKQCTGHGKQKTNTLKFSEKYSISKSGCFEWNRNRNSDGYGIVRYKGKPALAHRVSYEIHNGKILNNLHVLHKCDNPCCVNPSHLFLGTHKDNMQDMIKKNRRKTKLSFEDVLFIRESTLTNLELSKKFSVSERTIRYAKHPTHWQPLPAIPTDKE